MGQHDGTHNLSRYTPAIIACDEVTCPYVEYSPTDESNLDPEPFVCGQRREPHIFPGSIFEPRRGYKQDLRDYPAIVWQTRDHHTITKDSEKAMTEAPLTAQQIRAAVAELPDNYAVTEDLLKRLVGKTTQERRAVEIAHRHMEDLGARLPSGVAIPMGAVSPIRSTIEAAVEEALRAPRSTLTENEVEGAVNRARRYFQAQAEKSRGDENVVPGAPLKETFRWLIQNGARV